jgi:hypothetical protein
VKLFDLSLVIFGPPNFIGKYTGQPVDRLSFSRRHLRRMDFMLGGNLLRRLVSTERLKRHRGLKLV